MTTSKADRKNMELAVAEMRKSRSEHADKRDPMVGAVIVGPDGIPMAASFRGDLREGDHAEFTLIERLLHDKRLDDTTLYVTLEPCTKRNSPKKPCVERILKARIGRVFIGMTDPNPDICGRGIQELQKHRVEVDFFDVDLVQQIRDANRGFIEYFDEKEGSGAGVTEPFEGPSALEREVVDRASTKSLSEDALSRYVAQRGLNLAVPSKELWKTLECGGYLGRTAKNKIAPTVAGLALFGSAPAEILPQCRVSLEARKGGRTVNGDFEGPLIGFRDHLDAFCKENMRHFTEIRGLDRVKVGEYPMEAVREAAFNALIHREYKGGTRVHITLKESEIEVRSPGCLLKPLSLARVRAFNAAPYSRNPHIAVAIQRMGWIDEKGSGLTRMRDKMLEYSLRPPIFDFKDGYFVVILPGQEQTWANVRVAPALLATLEEHQRTIVALVMSHGRVATADCAKALDIGLATARRHLRRLVDQGILEPRGSGPQQSYQLSGVE